MVFLRSFSTVVIFLLLLGLPCACQDTLETQHGYIMDRRGYVDGSYIRPPHPENIPAKSKIIQPVVDFESYYKVNAEGYRAPEDKLPIVPGYTANYSTRRPHLYTKEDYINVWCNGKKHVGKIDCLTDEFAISFFPVSSWARGVTTAAWRARKYSQKGVAVFYAEDMGALTGDMYEAKMWAEKWGSLVMFVTVDAGIPHEWIR